jgi:hypothetical protein
MTGELCAGEPHAQFGGRGGRESFPTPIIGTNFTVRVNARLSAIRLTAACQITPAHRLKLAQTSPNL